ncbi:MAG TPA: YdeI/OmpD-associated family protein [Caulobacteraceae bacterium]|jgi:hypothetical protein
MTTQRFKTRIVAGESKNVAGIEVPAEVVAALGPGERPRVKVTINAYSYVSTIGKMAGRHMIGLSAEHRGASGLAGGDMADVRLEVMTEAPDIPVPPDLEAALAKAGALDAFKAAAPSRRKEWVRQVETAKAPETRTRRIEKVTAELGR